MQFEVQDLKFDKKYIEKLRERFREHYNEHPRYLKHLSRVLPVSLVKIRHRGPLKILAFSDYRVHDIRLLLRLVKELDEKPDIILYAGDDISRFVPHVHWLFPHLYEPYEYLKSVERQNYFEALAREAKYGLGAVIGNDEPPSIRQEIRGEKVYGLHSTWLKIGSYLIIGLECVPVGNIIGRCLYAEADYRLILELAKSLIGKRDKLIVVSHSPPYGVLDRALRFGERSIGSLALREFIEKFSRVLLVICGHVHSCGGMYEKVGHTTVVNASSHDDEYSRANIALIVVKGSEVRVTFYKLPSPIEQVFKEVDKRLWMKTLIERFRKSESEARLLINAYEQFGDKLLEDLEQLARLKFRYGFTWDNVFRLYAYGVTRPEQITEDIYLKVLSESTFPHDNVIKTAYLRIIREREKGIHLLKPLPFSLRDKLMVFDFEYIPDGPIVLYGFLDLVTGEMKQFWFNEQSALLRYLEEKQREDYVFIHWGGEDKKRLLGLVKNIKVVNLLWYVQTSLVVPVATNTLRDIHDILCGHKYDEWWNNFFYNIDGIMKLAMCKRILGSGSSEDMMRLSEINKADLLALACVVKRMMELPVKTNVDKKSE